MWPHSGWCCTEPAAGAGIREATATKVTLASQQHEDDGTDSAVGEEQGGARKPA